MATQQEILDILVQATGTKDVAEVVTQMRGIVEAGGEAAPAAQRVLEAFEAIGTQTNAASAIASIRAAATETADALVAARLKVEQFEAQFDAAEAPSARLTASLTKARAAVAALQAQFNQQQAAVTSAENALAAAGVSTENLDATQRELQATLAQTRVEAEGLAVGFKEASAAGEREALTMSEIAERNAVLRAGFEQLKALLLTFAGVVAFEKIKEDIGEVIQTGDKFERWGAQFKNAFGGAEQGAEALAKVKEIAEATPLSLDQVTAAALQAKKEGLDPFNGSLEAIIATSVKYGGGADTVNELITALGRSANQGGLSIRALTALQQQGIPAAQLLGDAMGKTADQVTQLAKNGKLGADSVATLISALGRHSTGGLADEMGLVSTQVQKAKDNYDEFLELIAKSGAYEFVKTQLASVNAAFKEGLESGSLQQSAKAISDGLISIGNALITVTRFAVEHGAAIKEVVEDYVIFKTALLAVDLVGAAGRFVGLTAATKEAGAAAEAAAVGGVGKLGTAIGKIPRNVQIAVALAGAEFAISETLKVVDTLGKITAQTNAARDAQNQYGSDLAALAQRAQVVAAQNAKYAQIQLLQGDQIEQQNRAQSEAYLVSLQGATRYYQALQIQAKAIGDNTGVEDAAKALGILGQQTQFTQQHLASLNAALQHSSEAVGAVVDRFDDFRNAGASAATAVTGAFERIEVGTPQGLLDAIDIIRQLTARGKEAKAAIQSELVVALDKLDATDLAAFQENVTKKLAEAKGNADELKTALGAALQTALERLGLTAEQAGQKVTTAGQTIIASFTDVARNAQATGQQIQLAFATGLSKLTTSGEVEALEEQLKAAFDGGRISADQFSAGMAAAGRKIADLQVAAVEAGAGLDGMGTVGQTSAQRIVLALEDARDKVATEAAGIAASITAALADGSDTTELKANLAKAEAEIADFNARIASAQSSGPQSVKQTTAALQDNTQAVEQNKAAVDDATKTIQEYGDEGGSSLAELDNALANTRQQFVNVSDAAAKAFDANLVGDFGQKFDATGIGFARVIGAMAQASADVNQKISDQRTQLQAEIADINNVGIASDKGFGTFGDNADAAIAKMESLSIDIQQGNYDAGLLGQQELQPLQQALDAAKQRVQALADATKQAKDQLASMGDQLQDDLDSANGNDTAVEDRRFQKQLDDLKAAAQAAGELSSQQYQTDVENANALHALKLQQIQQQQAAQNGNGSSGGGSSSSGSQVASGGGGALPSNGAKGLAPVHIHIDGQQQLGQIAADEPGQQLLLAILRAKGNSI